MKRSILSMGKILLALLLLVFSIVVLLPIPLVAQMNPKTRVYLDPPTINCTAIGVDNFVIVNVMIRTSINAYLTSWAAGMRFNATLLECTAFKEGEFLSDVAGTWWQGNTINNTAGIIEYHGCGLYGSNKATGEGRLAYLNLTVKAPGVTNLHLRDVTVWNRDIGNVPTEIIDVYTAVVDTIPHNVVTVSNSTRSTAWYHSGFYDYAYNPVTKELSFSVTSPKPSYCNVTIPKALLPPPEPPIEWKVLIDDTLLSTGERTVTENATHTCIYFTYSLGIHKIRITTRMSSTTSLALSLTSISLGWNMTISGNVTAEDLTVRPNVNVTISSRPSGGTWSTLQVVETDSNGNYTYLWKPGEAGTCEVIASWEGDNETLEDKSDVETLSVRAFYVFEVEGLKVVIQTNSTISAFNFSQPLKQISFNVTTPYGIIGFSNVTIPKALLPPPEPPIEWKVLINGTLLNAEEIVVTENATHTCIYFTYSKGFNVVEITTRMRSIISLALSSNSTNLGSSVTISGNITREDYTGRPNVNVTIQSRPFNITAKIFVPIWDTIDTVETDSNSDYISAWAPGASGIYEVMASWEGDNETLDGKSDVQILAVIENSTISIALSSANITFGSRVTIRGSIEPLKQGMVVTIRYKLVDEAIWHAAGQNQTGQDSRYTFTWTPDTPGTYQVKTTWLGYNITIDTKNYMIIRGAESDVLILTAKRTGIISIDLSSTEITKGKSVTISGNITAEDLTARPNANVTILYRLSGDVDWTTLDTVQTDENGNYTYSWKPEETGTYEVMASWEGDDITFGNESDVLTLEVKGAAAFPLMYVVAAVIAIIVIAAIAVYFIKFRKPR